MLAFQASRFGKLINGWDQIAYRSVMPFDTPRKQMDNLVQTDVWFVPRGVLQYDWQSCKQIHRLRIAVWSIWVLW